MEQKTTWDKIQDLKGRLAYFLSEYATKSMSPLEFDEYFNEFKKTLENIKSDEKIIHETETSNLYGECWYHEFITNDEQNELVLKVHLLTNDEFGKSIVVDYEYVNWRARYKKEKDK